MKHLACGVCFVFICCIKIIRSNIPMQIFQSFVQLNDLHIVQVFHCWPQNEVISSMNALRYKRHQLHNIQTDEIDLNQILHVNYYKVGILFDLDCDRQSSVTEQMQENNLIFNETYHWLMYTTNRNCTNFLDSLPLSIDAEVTLAICDQNCTLHDVYNPSYKHGGSLHINLIGDFTQDGGLNMIDRSYKYDRRNNLDGIQLNFSTVIHNPPHGLDIISYLTKPIDPHIDTMQRYNFNLLLELRDHYNFSINLMRYSTWGYLINGKFNGIIGDMINGVIDVAAVPMNIHKAERHAVMDYTVVIWTVKLSIFFRHPKKNLMKNNFLKPLSESVWYAALFVTATNWILLYATTKIKINYLKIRDGDKRESPFSDVSLMTAAAVSQQGACEISGILSFKIIFLSLFTWAMLVYQFYSASIVGSLIAEPPRFITNVYELADSPLEFGAEDIGYMIDLFDTSTDPALRYLYDKKVSTNKKKPKKLFYSVKEGFKNVKKGGFAFYLDTATAYKTIQETFTDDEICELSELEIIKPVQCSTATSKFSPFNELITYGFRKMIERGTQKRLQNVWLHKRPQCPESHKSKPTAITLQEFFPAIIIVIGGVIGGIVIAVIEFIVHYYKRRSTVI